MGIAKELYKIYRKLATMVGRYARVYYFEDYRRVYPDGVTYYPFGIRRSASKIDLNNYRNHLKFYLFAAQFVKGKDVADIGCGSGYGCNVLNNAGAKQVYGMDASNKSIEFAVSHYGNVAKFSRQSVTDIVGYTDNCVDVAMSSEVLEHIKEYGMEDQALRELKRITREKGLIIVATPNAEMLHDHGFEYSEMKALIGKHFSNFLIFENALVPYGKAKERWRKRVEDGQYGVVVSQLINFEETVIAKGMATETKRGIEPGKMELSGWNIDTSLLHNTHSWIILAVNEK